MPSTLVLVSILVVGEHPLLLVLVKSVNWLADRPNRLIFMLGWIQVWVVALFFGLALPGQPKKQSNNPNILLLFMLLGPGPT